MKVLSALPAYSVADARDRLQLADSVTQAGDTPGHAPSASVNCYAQAYPSFEGDRRAAGATQIQRSRGAAFMLSALDRESEVFATRSAPRRLLE